MTTGEEVAH